MDGPRWEQARKRAKEMFQGSPDRNPQEEELLRTPKAQSKPPEPRKSPLRQFWDKAKDGDRLDLSWENKEVQLNFEATGEKEVKEYEQKKD